MAILIVSNRIPRKQLYVSQPSCLATTLLRRSGVKECCKRWAGLGRKKCLWIGRGGIKEM
ncbi:hypothetical protein HBH56_212010 [Parastagonospora nodorum]|uniref:Uncharacterized protein n=1 Tax=Phaeosphaeria nodorum (strain SN15 / ATCC MYA-4574 / FGSC 10173) TaxID=321614 RepID=A0A7U2IA25_PHANO|nr:hypothetical protein HBH56_212010 [Parastagonospora nodorum]QRD06037.1 hypothetical protein JI435_423050 [Parastagonospora nodorum SN15]KAH3931564.1 hypothetical protein HBH54_100620 [Parastagonospora nodorum]KAH3960756.1 hypothetical protein HBH51_190300 [Parastagonospora nodorum]KAH3962766.1 hypothetical protein HBH52_222960 [Parastagonospora nodorum]